jgi:hypothetical protein
MTIHSTVIAGIDWSKIKKGDSIPEIKIKEMWEIKIGNNKPWNDFSDLAVKQWLETALNSIGRKIVFRQQGGNLIALTDDEAVGYLNSQASAGLRKHRANTRRLFTHIEDDNLSPFAVDQLAVNRARHALIASAADGAKKQVITLLKSGSKLPKLTPPED